MVLLGARLHERIDVLDVLGHEFVLVADVLEHLGSVDEERAVVDLTLGENDDARRDRHAEKEVRGQLDNRLDEVVVDQILADLLLRAAAVQHAGELDDCRAALAREPREHVHRES